MERDLFEIGKAITTGIFDGSTAWHVMLTVMILAGCMLLKIVLEKIKYTHPKLTITILILLFSFAIFLAVSEFAGDDKKKNAADTEQVEYQTDYPNIESDSIVTASPVDSTK